MNSSEASSANFDRIAGCYRWLEYLTFGSTLQRIRTYFLPNLRVCRRALLYGDGDGRFLAQLLADNPFLTAEAIDTSAHMLDLLSRRVEPFSRVSVSAASSVKSSDTTRVRTYNQNALTYLPTLPPDVVVTHFFLDCLSQSEVDQLIENVTPLLAPRALWLVSEFRIPQNALGFPALLLVRALYFAFRLLTGLRVTHLPEHHAALSRAGFTNVSFHHRLFGVLTAELWQMR